MIFLYLGLRLIHITCFALWMGTIVASLLVIRTLEPRLTSPDGAADEALLRGYIRREVKLVDVAFLGMLFSGLALAHLYVGWTTWVFMKIGLFVAQFVATMGYIVVRVRPLTYPCTPQRYRRWYELIGISLSFFALTLLVVFFGRWS